jgi:hypothetical protein
MSGKATYKGHREIRTYVTLYYAASALTKRAENDVKGRTYTLMGALVLCAFTFEAYLNHLGEGKLHLWKKTDFINVWAKNDMVCKHLKLSPDFSRRPHKSLRKLFKLRDRLAHGRSETLTTKKYVGTGYEPPLLSPKAAWEKGVNLEFCKQATGDLCKVLKQMHAAAGLGDYPFSHGVTSYTIKA